jgi:hypothetical protein
MFSLPGHFKVFKDDGISPHRPRKSLDLDFSLGRTIDFSFDQRPGGMADENPSEFTGTSQTRGQIHRQAMTVYSFLSSDPNPSTQEIMLAYLNTKLSALKDNLLMESHML